MKIKKLLFLFAISFLLSIILAFPRNQGWLISHIPGLEGFKASSFFGFVVYFFLTAFFLCKYKGVLKKTHIILAIWIGISILEWPYRLHKGMPFFIETFISLPNTLIWWFGILCGLFYTLISNSRVKVIYTVLVGLLFFFISTKGYDLWLHKLGHGTFTGRIVENYPSSITFQNDEGEDIALDDLGGEYLVLDFWTSWCGVCFEKFPKVQQIYDKWRDNERMQLYSVFCRFEKDYGETPATGTKELREIGYTFPTLSIDIDDPILKELGVNCYPTVLIFNNKDRTLIFRGRIENAEKLLSKILK